jgi:ADP-ribosyl-[dinitrogen reductase] hydrolase
LDRIGRYRGSLLGLACGDAVGTTVEFQPRGSFEPLTGMVGGGVFGLEPGQWTDDTSMALCLAESLVECQGLDMADQLHRYTRWWKEGYLSSTGECFDIGTTVAGALYFYERNGEVFADTNHPQMAGNGSIMRLAPVVLWYAADRSAALEHAALSSKTTHAADEAVDCCRLMAWVLCNLLEGRGREAMLEGAAALDLVPRVAAIAGGGFLGKSPAQIRGSGYCIDSLEAALWCVHHAASFEEAVLLAANLGDDADTTAAVTGQIAGALHGVDAIPAAWLQQLHLRDYIDGLAVRLHAHAAAKDAGAIEQE